VTWADVDAASAALQAHYPCTVRPGECGRGGADSMCPEGVQLYGAYLTAEAAMRGFHPQSLPGVRAAMRARGEEPMPMEEASAWKPEKASKP
jgi:hypothetical protein